MEIGPYGRKEPGIQGSVAVVSVRYIVSVGVREKVRLSHSIFSVITHTFLACRPRRFGFQSFLFKNMEETWVFAWLAFFLLQ